MRLTDDQAVELSAAIVKQALKDATALPPRRPVETKWKADTTIPSPLREWYQDYRDAVLWFHSRGGLFRTVCEVCNPDTPALPRERILAQIGVQGRGRA